jgi:pimeloyl-ACP methyl ester carboxylesterase
MGEEIVTLLIGASASTSILLAALPAVRKLRSPASEAQRTDRSWYRAKNVSVPAGVSVFPGERYQAPRSCAERAYPRLIYYNQLDKGGHFAAWEQPELLAAEVRAAFRSLR